MDDNRYKFKHTDINDIDVNQVTLIIAHPKQKFGFRLGFSEQYGKKHHTIIKLPVSTYGSKYCDYAEILKTFGDETYTLSLGASYNTFNSFESFLYDKLIPKIKQKYTNIKTIPNFLTTDTLNKKIFYRIRKIEKLDFPIFVKNNNTLTKIFPKNIDELKQNLGTFGYIIPYVELFISSYEGRCVLSLHPVKFIISKTELYDDYEHNSPKSDIKIAELDENVLKEFSNYLKTELSI